MLLPLRIQQAPRFPRVQLSFRHRFILKIRAICFVQSGLFSSLILSFMSFLLVVELITLRLLLLLLSVSVSSICGSILSLTKLIVALNTLVKENNNSSYLSFIVCSFFPFFLFVSVIGHGGVLMQSGVVQNTSIVILRNYFNSEVLLYYIYRKIDSKFD